jgi:AcrR family transcriptional regulator
VKKPAKCFIFGCKTAPSDKTREQILIQAKKSFAEHGYEGASLREICNSANANVSAVKYHFGDKEGLYRTCLSEYAESRLSVVTNILTPANSEEELKIKLRLFAEDFLTESFNDFDMSRMLFREIEKMNSIMEGIFEGTFLQFYKQLAYILEDAQTKKIISKNINIETTTCTIFYFLSQTVRMHHVTKKFFKKNLRNSEIQKEQVDNLLTILFHGITP